MAFMLLSIWKKIFLCGKVIIWLISLMSHAVWLWMVYLICSMMLNHSLTSVKIRRHNIYYQANPYKHGPANIWLTASTYHLLNELISTPANKQFISIRKRKHYNSYTKPERFIQRLMKMQFHPKQFIWTPLFNTCNSKHKVSGFEDSH